MKLDFNSALSRISDGFSVKSADVLARALPRVIWVAEWHLPGCCSESQTLALSKHEAILCALSMAEGADGPPRGMRSDLHRYGASQRTAPDAWARGAITSIYRVRLSDLCS